GPFPPRAQVEIQRPLALEIWIPDLVPALCEQGTIAVKLEKSRRAPGSAEISSQRHPRKRTEYSSDISTAYRPGALVAGLQSERRICLGSQAPRINTGAGEERPGPRYRFLEYESSGGFYRCIGNQKD